MKARTIENVNVIGVATTRPGEHWKMSLENMAVEVSTQAARDADISLHSVDSLYVGNMLAGILGEQSNLGAAMAGCLGLDIPAYSVEGGCASGGLALCAAIKDVISGASETALVLGVEKMTDWPVLNVTKALMTAGSEEEQLAGATQPGLFALLARRHMEEFGTTSDQLASASVNAHHNAMLNPKAQFHRELTIEQVRKSYLVADPLHALDCSPIGDGAAAVIITGRNLSDRNRGVRVLASSVSSDCPGLGQRKSLTELRATRMSAQNAYEQAGIGPGDIDVAEVDDCFTISHLLAVEDLGFRKKGEAAHAISTVINSSGGLKAGGNPVGAVGVYQVAEITTQLRGEAGSRQVSRRRFGLTHDVSGTGVISVVHIFGKE